MAITALPALNRTASTFRDDVDTFFGTQLPAFSVETEAARIEINNNTTIATTQAQLATTQAQLATTQATAAAASALSAGATIWVSGTTYTAGVSKYSPLDGQVYRRMITGAGTTDPSQDAVNWRVVNGLTSEMIVLPFNNLPSMRPSLSLDFANNQIVDPRITFTRASTATRTNSKGLIEAAASGVPRIDYDAVTGACKGLLIEEQRVNLLTYSEQFDNAAWIKNQVTVAANATIAPDGATTADKLVESVANSTHSVYQGGVGVVSGTTYTYAVFVKAAERTKFEISFNSNSSAFADSQASFDLVAVTSSSANTLSHGIRSVGNGWYLCWATEAATASVNCVIELRVVAATTIYTGDGVSCLSIWGAQLEAGVFPTSYIPTVASQVTRAADVASMTGANFSSWYRQDEGSFVAETLLARQAAIAGTRQYTVSDGATSSIGSFYRGSGATGATVLVSGVTQTDLAPTGVIAANTPAKVALAYKVNDFAASGNGAATLTDTSGTIPILDRLHLGTDLGNYLNGHVRSLTYYPKRLTNAELQSLSAQ